GDVSHACGAGRSRGNICVSAGNQFANASHWEGVDRVSGGFATGAAPRDGRLPMSTSQGAGGPDLSVSFAGIPLKNPVIAASGTRLLDEVVNAARRVSQRPLSVKLSPNVTSSAHMARVAEEAGADAISLVNTFMAMAIDAETRKPRIANVTAGLSGPAIKPI